uniref:Uncharacterized protein n=1 Tax=Panagrolaimus sp. ES5 TaxID=591445 RepID=A0AC34F272_9BILA
MFAMHECVYTLRTCFKTRQSPETRSQFFPDERPYEAFENVNFEANEVHSLEQVNPDRFGLAFKTPWLTLHHPAYQDYDPFNIAADHEKKRLRLPGIKAYALTGKKVYIPSKPRWLVSLDHNKISSLHPGARIRPQMPLLVDVRYNDYLSRYIVCDAKASDEGDLPAPLVENLYHRAPLSPVPECPGYFVYHDIGLVFDKYGQMCAYYSSDRHEKIDVDFTYTFDGVYIGNNEFYCPYLHFWFLRAPANMELSIGNVEAQIVPDLDPVPHKMVQETPEFLVQINVHRAAGNQILVAPVIGPIGITDLELARFDNIRAVAIQFPLGEVLPEDRPHRRPYVTRMFKTFENGKSIGGYK